MPKQKTAQQWLQLIEQQALSGLSITDFCQQHNLSTKSFYYHRAKHHKKKAPQKPQSSFVAAQPAVPAPVSQPPLLQLKHGQSTVLLPSTTDTLWLAALLSSEDYEIQKKLDVLALADKLGNVAEASRLSGVSRDTI